MLSKLELEDSDVVEGRLVEEQLPVCDASPADGIFRFLVLLVYSNESNPSAASVTDDECQ